MADPTHITFADLSGNGNGVKRGPVTKRHVSPKSFAVTLDDDNNEAQAFRALRNEDSSAGTIVMIDIQGNTRTFTNVQAGQTIRIQGIRVLSTGTTLTAIEAFV